jgi:hypothetical protein
MAIDLYKTDVPSRYSGWGGMVWNGLEWVGVGWSGLRWQLSTSTRWCCVVVLCLILLLFGLRNIDPWRIASTQEARCLGSDRKSSSGRSYTTWQPPQVLILSIPTTEVLCCCWHCRHTSESKHFESPVDLVKRRNYNNKRDTVRVGRQ